jgi:hypothetical protein
VVYLLYKKISEEKNMSKGSLYEKWWGTTITLRDECFYVWVCLRETVSILKIHYAYIFFEDKKQEKNEIRV